MPQLVGKVLSVSIIILSMRACVMACKFGLVIFIGRYFDLSSLGIYGLAAGAIAIGPEVIGMGMVHVIMRDAVTQSLSEMTKNLRFYWSFTTCIYGSILGISVLLTTMLGISALWSLVVLVMLFEKLGNDVFYLFSNMERPILANLSAFLRGAVWILIYIPVAILDPDFRTLTALFSFWLAGSTLAFVMFICASRSWPWKVAFAFPFRLGWLTTTIRQASIIYISDLSFVSSQYIDRYLVSIFLGLEFAGIYFVYWSVANATATLISMTVLQLQRPRLIRAHHEGGQPEHRKLTSHFLKSTAMATVILNLATGCVFLLLLPFLKQPSVAHHLAAFWLIMVGMAVRSVADFGAIALFTARRDQLMTLTNVASVAALVVAQVILLPLAGLYGAGAAILVTFAAIAVWRYRLIFAASVSKTDAKKPQQVDA